MTVVAFSSSTFLARYPEFSSVSTDLLSAYFTEAGLYLDNTDNSIVQNTTTRLLLLNMLTAHIAMLNGALSADGLPLPVGRISNASEGSVSTALDYIEPGTEAWFVQTQYGAAFWQASLRYRLARYIPRPTVWR